MFADEVRGSIDETNAMVQQLGESNPILRGFLVNAMEEMRQSIVRVSDGTTKASDYYGRRLMQRQFDYPTYMNEILIDHPIMTQFGKEGLPGVTIEGCEALCEGVSVFSNRTDKRECRALAFKRVDPFSTTDFTGRCYLLQNAGSCKVEDFASELYTRQIESEEVCHKPVSHYENPLCIQLPTTRTDTRVLTHFDATAIAAQTPTPAAPGSGGLPQPRTTLEAGFFIALARREGIYSFWSANPDTTNGNVTLHWITEGGSELVYRQGESRCVLVSSATSTATTKMYASLEPCTAKLATGCSPWPRPRAPPPPGGGGSSFFDRGRSPPPPPSIKSHAITIYTRETIQPLTGSVCSGAAGEGTIHRTICSKFLEEVGKFQFIYGVGTVAPLCSPYCWHSCIGDHLGGEDHDDFNNCKQPECAQTGCYDFLLRECDPIQHSLITARYRNSVRLSPITTSTSGTTAPPPQPPRSPSPRAPPAVRFFERLRDEETDSDADCELTMRRMPRSRSPLRGSKPGVSVICESSHCEGLENEADCFLGCAYGDDSGGTYRFLLPNRPTRNPLQARRIRVVRVPMQETQPTYDVESSTPTTFAEQWDMCRFHSSSPTARR